MANYKSKTMLGGFIFQVVSNKGLTLTVGDMVKSYNNMVEHQIDKFEIKPFDFSGHYDIMCYYSNTHPNSCKHQMSIDNINSVITLKETA